MTWPTGARERLAELRAQKEIISFSEIALLLNREFGTHFTKCACIGMARRMNLPRRELLPGHCIPLRNRRRVMVDAPIVPKTTPPRRNKPLTIYQLRDGRCHWPLGKWNAPPPFWYCGEYTSGRDQVYCPEHRTKSYTKDNRG